MSNYLVTDTELTSIADTIRTKSGQSGSLSFPTGFIDGINSISGGGDSELVTLYSGTGSPSLYYTPADSYNSSTGEYELVPTDEIKGYLPIVCFYADGENIMVCDFEGNYYEIAGPEGDIGNLYYAKLIGYTPEYGDLFVECD